MSLLNALILGLIQGVAEFLPISSSGHLSIAQIGRASCRERVLIQV